MHDLVAGEVTRPRLRFHLPLDPARLWRARQRIRDYLHEQGLEHTVVEDVVLAVEEAMSNAVRHSGAREDIVIHLFFNGSDLIAEVEDRGVGFDVDSFDPTRRPDPLVSSGRGLYLVAQLTDELSLFSDGGLAVRAVKRNVLGTAQTPGSDRSDLAVPGAQAHREARQRALLDEIEDQFLAFDWEYRLIHANAATCRYTGKPPEELVGRSFQDLLPAASGRVGEAAKQAMQLGTPAVVEYESKPGPDRWFVARIYPTSFGISVLQADVSDRKSEEFEREELLLALRESERQFGSLFDSMLEGVVLHELVYVEGRAVDYRILESNPAFERQTGLSREQARGSLASELYGAGEAPYLADFARVAESGQACSFETHFQPLNRSFHVTAVPLAPGRFATIFEDVTERKRADEELRALYEAKQRIAATLQENLVHPLPTIAGLDLAVLSLPAHRPELLGGDFHDVFKVADNRVVVLIGDVVGKGVKAAGLTETVHSAVRALALVTDSPEKILHHMNHLLLAEEYEQFVSALVLLLDPTTGRCLLASAGHPPPIIVSGGEAHLVEPRYGPPLGTFESVFVARELDFSTGETLVLYTDGLTEARCGAELFGERRLLDAACGAPDRAPRALIEHLREAVLAYAGTLRDDLEILALRRTKPLD